MKKETKMVYETPWMECMQIEAEGTFAGSIVDNNGKGTDVTAESQSYVEFSNSSTWTEGTDGTLQQNENDVIKWD